MHQLMPTLQKMVVRSAVERIAVRFLEGMTCSF